MLRTMMTDAQLWATVQQHLDHWNDNWGDRTAWSKETAWTLAATLDAQAQVAQSRYTVDRGRPAEDPFQLLRALGLITVRQIPSLVDTVAPDGTVLDINSIGDAPRNPALGGRQCTAARTRRGLAHLVPGRLAVKRTDRALSCEVQGQHARRITSRNGPGNLNVRCRDASHDTGEAYGSST